MGCPGMTDLTFRSFVQNFTTVYLIFKHRDDISQKTVPPPPPPVIKPTDEVIIGSSDDGILFHTISDHSPRARPADINLFASQEPALFLCLRKHRH